MTKKYVSIPSDPSLTTETGDEILPWADYRAVREKEYLVKLMTRCRGNIQSACRISGLSRSRLYQLLNRYGLSGQ